PPRLLFLFDEPTTGLQFHDSRVLMAALRQLIAAGHSLLVIVHDLDVIGAADGNIDIGPEGGDQGGALVAHGTPAELIAAGVGLTAQALREHQHNLNAVREAAGTGAATWASAMTTQRPPALPSAIQIHHAREHNLKN